MLIYMLKSGICLAILLLFYKLFLEKENMHVFKRFYLLGALVFALVIPTIVFTEYVEVVSTTYATTPDLTAAGMNPNIPAKLEADVLDIAPILWGIYFAGLFFFGIRFLKNLFQIFQRIRRNPKYRNAHFVQVLLREKIPPHTFFRYIFLNRSKFESNEIPKEVLLHEETHARERHSLDVVFVELLQVVLWVNPLIYFFKKAIKLNHEFLADKAVLDRDIDTATYQNTLLSFLSSQSAQKCQPSLPNSINYSLNRARRSRSIKKRFKVMKSKTSKRAIFLRTLLLVPITVFLLFGFSNRQEVIKTSTDEVSKSSDYTARSISIKILEDDNYLVEGSIVNKNKLVEVIDKLHQDITPEIRNRILNIHLSSATKISKEEVWFIYNSLLEYGFYRLVTDDQEIIRTKGNKPFAIENEYDQNQGASRQEIKEYNALAKKYNKIPITERVVPSADLEILEFVYRSMTESQKSEAEPFPECPPQEGATKAQVAEYNALAKKYGELLEQNHIRIRKSDVDRLEYLYNLMSEEQRANVEPFPDFPKPPVPPETPEFPSAAQNVEFGEIRGPEPPRPPEAVEPIAEKRPIVRPEAPAPPAEPKSPIEFVEEMKGKNAVFQYDGKEISADQAIELLETSKNLSLEARHTGLERPIIKLSKGPIHVRTDN